MRLDAAAAALLEPTADSLTVEAVGLTAGAAAVLAAKRCHLTLLLGTLDREVARVLATHRGELYVFGVESLDEAAAREIVRHEGTVHLWKADGITPAAAAVLRQRKAIRFPGM